MGSPESLFPNGLIGYALNAGHRSSEMKRMFTLFLQKLKSNAGRPEQGRILDRKDS